MEDKKQLYDKVFRGETDRIPLIVKVANNEHRGHSCIECQEDPQKVIDDFLSSNKYNLQFESDWVPAIESNFLENLIPSYFGAQSHLTPGGDVDVRTIWKTIEGIDHLDKVVMGGELLEKAERHLRYLIQNTPEDIHVTPSRFMSPLDYGVVLRGGDFYMELLLYPDEAKAIMNRMVELIIQTYKYHKDILKQPYNESITVRGMYFPGIRLTGNSIVNLSPMHIKEMLIPEFNKFVDMAGNLMLHYCCLPAPAGHVITALNDCLGLIAVDNWQGYQTFFTNNETNLLQDTKAICTDLSVEQVRNVEELMKTDPFFSKVRRKGGRGITITVTAADVDEAKSLYDTWRNYFEKNIL